MKNIVATVASDVKSHAETLQGRRALNAARIDGMDLDGADDAIQAQATVEVLPPPQLSSAELSDKTATQ